MSKLKSNLADLKSKLKDIEVQIQEAANSKAIKEMKYNSIKEKIDEVLSNKQVINLNIGGVIFATTKSNLIKDDKSIFAILLNEDNNINELFFDRSPRLFHIILNYLRSGKINYNYLSKEDKIELYNEALFYEVTDIRDYLEEISKPIIPISFTFSGAYSYNNKVIGDNDLISLTDKDLKTGICCNSPGWIEIELNALHEFQEIELAGYQGKKSDWYSGNGAGAQVLISENSTSYKKIGNIPIKFDREVVTIRLDSKVRAKYVKILNSTYLGLGYFNVVKIEDI